MPVLPDVGSISVVLPGVIFPAASITVIICSPMRSFTLAIGLKNSSLARRLALTPFSFAIFFSRTRGVLPIVSVIEVIDAATSWRRRWGGAFGLICGGLRHGCVLQMS